MLKPLRCSATLWTALYQKVTARAASSGAACHSAQCHTDDDFPFQKVKLGHRRNTAALEVDQRHIVAAVANNSDLVDEPAGNYWSEKSGNCHGKCRNIEVTEPHGDDHHCQNMRPGDRRIARRIGRCSSLRCGTTDILPEKKERERERKQALRVLSHKSGGRRREKRHRKGVRRERSQIQEEISTRNYCPSDALSLPVLARRVASASTVCARSG